MPLQTPAEKVTATIADLANSATAHLRSQIECLNAQARTVAQADNETLAEWLNSRGARLAADLAFHGLSGDCANAQAALMETATGETLPRVDVSSFADKLAATGRTATLTPTGWIVEDIVLPVAEPVAEPEPESEQ